MCTCTNASHILILGLAVIMPTPDQCSGSNSPIHTSENTKEMNSNQTDTDKRFAV